jgi:peptide/nickel transport system substrate-binding protein
MTMVRYWYRKVQAVVLTGSALALLLAVACGGAAPATPAAPPAAKAPAAPAASAATAVPTPVPAAAKAAAPGKAKVNKLIMGLTTAGWETNLVWAGSVDHHAQHELVMESLVDIDPKTNGYIPELAYKWEMSPNGKDWTFWLNKGVQFHDNWGEFTAKDVAWSVETQKRPDSLMAYVTSFRDIDNVEAINDYQVVLHLKNADPDFLFYIAPSGGMLMQSKAFWDAKGLDGYLDKIVGTGPYRYKGRELGRYIAFERLPTHWRVKHTDWPEFEIRWMPEDSTRLAALITKEIHITELPRSLTDDAARTKGMKVITSIFPGNQILIQMGGLYFNTPDKLDPQNPFTNIKVRQALNKAINKKELARTLFSDRVTISPVLGYYPNLPGWNPAWLEKYDKLYGYDLAGAKKLMAEAGYPSGFKTKGFLTVTYGFPEALDLLQSIQVYWKPLGVDMELEEIERPRMIKQARARELSNRVITVSPSYKTVSSQIGLFNYTKGNGTRVFEDDWIDGKYKELQLLVDSAPRDKLLRQIGDYKFEQFENVPLFFYFIEMVVDPNIVDKWPFPGSDGANHGHYDLITACTTPTPCR